MMRAAVTMLLMTAILAGSSAAGEKKPAPKLTQEAKDGLQIAQENILKLKLRAIRPTLPNPRTPSSPTHPHPSTPGS